MGKVCYIPNLNVEKQYSHEFEDENNFHNSEFHFETLKNLADFFGRDMKLHHHDSYFQIHIILNGTAMIQLDDKKYSVVDESVFFTPPSVPHSFIIDNHSAGFVLTLQQHMVWRLLDVKNGSGGIVNKNINAFAVQIGKSNRLVGLFEMLSEELAVERFMNNDSINSIIKLILITVLRLGNGYKNKYLNRSVDYNLFHRFSNQVENNFREHHKIPQYAINLGVSVSRLNDVCLKISGETAKTIISKRVVQEARRLLSFTSLSVSNVAYNLGFQDPAYFSRFFKRMTGDSASDYRAVTECKVGSG